MMFLSMYFTRLLKKAFLCKVITPPFRSGGGVWYPTILFHLWLFSCSYPESRNCSNLVSLSIAMLIAPLEISSYKMSLFSSFILLMFKTAMVLLKEPTDTFFGLFLGCFPSFSPFSELFSGKAYTASWFASLLILFLSACCSSFPLYSSGYLFLKNFSEGHLASLCFFL